MMFFSPNHESNDLNSSYEAELKLWSITDVQKWEIWMILQRLGQTFQMEKLRDKQRDWNEIQKSFKTR